MSAREALQQLYDAVKGSAFNEAGKVSANETDALRLAEQVLGYCPTCGQQRPEARP